MITRYVLLYESQLPEGQVPEDAFWEEGWNGTGSWAHVDDLLHVVEGKLWPDVSCGDGPHDGDELTLVYEEDGKVVYQPVIFETETTFYLRPVRKLSLSFRKP